jgi:uncharacterized membrane protein
MDPVQNQGSVGGRTTETSTPATPLQQTTNPTPKSEPVQVNNNMLMGILSYIGVLVLIPFLMEKHDPFVRFHVKQGLVLAVIGVAMWVVGNMLWIIWPLVMIVNVGLLVLSIMGIINVVNKRQVALPLVGHFADKFTI